MIYRVTWILLLSICFYSRVSGAPYAREILRIHRMVYRRPFDKNQMQRAIFLCRQLHKRYKDSAEIYMYQATAEYRLGLYSEAMDTAKIGKELLNKQLVPLKKDSRKKRALLLYRKEFEDLYDKAEGRRNQELYRKILIRQQRESSVRQRDHR